MPRSLTNAVRKRLVQLLDTVFTRPDGNSLWFLYVQKLMSDNGNVILDPKDMDFEPPFIRVWVSRK